MRTSGAILIWALIIFIVLSFKVGEDIDSGVVEDIVVAKERTIQTEEIGIDFCNGYMGKNKTYMGVGRI